MDRIGSDGTQPNNNLRLVVIVVTVDGVGEAWEELSGGSVAPTTASAIDAIFTCLIFEEVTATARPRLSRSKAGEMLASPGERLFLLAAAGCGSRAELLLLFFVRLLAAAAAAAAAPSVIAACDLVLVVRPSFSLGESNVLKIIHTGVSEDNTEISNANVEQIIKPTLT